MARKKHGALAVRLPAGLALREQTERALSPHVGESAELVMGLRRGRSGQLYSVTDAAEALAGAATPDELLAVTDELLPRTPPGTMGVSSIRRRPPWQEALEEHPPDNATPKP